ncbi:uncharacterized protein N7459_003125 [Penicillium hispanicum]|uniref:uncharacterized protein n=1 Tax=Penicillium hispanicum TaxID=1080232 RepID=UPI0025401229|nr:uncharacterized protein N7459_003125 [Penicillium hispanicum]KAJ5587360.1 hypothetical protein N7459_003125 [Penicillium hispanicum]
MAHWREEYLAALASGAADTRLADRTTTLPTPAGVGHSLSVDHRSPSLNQAQRKVSSSTATTKKQSPSEIDPTFTELLNTTRADLSEAQRSRSELQDRLKRLNTELEKLLQKNVQDGRRLKAWESERVHLQLRLKDRDEELRGKAKLLEDFQDEMATLNLQLNMAEDKSNKLQRENKELVDRWMARMSQEADAMNDASKFS